MFSAPRNNKTPSAHPAEYLTLKDQQGKVRLVLGQASSSAPGNEPILRERRAPGARDGSGMGFIQILQRDTRIPLPVAPSTPGSVPPTPLGSPGYRSASVKGSEDAQEWGKKTKKAQTTEINHPQPAPPPPERYRGTSSPPGASGRIFPSFHRRRGINYGTYPSQRAPRTLRGDARHPLAGGLGVGSPSSGAGTEPKEGRVFPGETQGFCFARGSAKGRGRAGGSPLAAARPRLAT